MNYPKIKERFLISKILFALVFIGFIGLIYLHYSLQLIGSDFILRLVGGFLILESVTKFLIFPYKENEHPLNYGRAIRVIIGAYFILFI